MNYLILFPEECQGGSQFVLPGRRAKFVLEYHDLKEGLSLSAGVLHGALGKAEVLEVKPDAVTLRFVAERAAPERLALTLIVAIPRPQTVKKILQLAAAVGLEALFFVQSQNVVPGYLQSKSLTPEFVRSELLKGLEQAGDTRLPKVEIFSSLSELFSRLDGAGKFDGWRILADTRARLKVAELRAQLTGAATGSALLAIGPEAGWQGSERQRFERRGFQAISLGERMLRVDQASCFLLGQLIEFAPRSLGAKAD